MAKAVGHRKAVRAEPRRENVVSTPRLGSILRDGLKKIW